MAKNQPRYEYKKIRALRELFHGRFTDTEVAMLLDLNHGNQHATLTYILEKDPKDVRMEVEKERLAWEAVNRIRPNCSSRLLDKAKSGKIESEGDLYACKACDSVWWRLSPLRKKVSKCFSCGRRFDMVPDHKWWGWAEFHCVPECQNVFYGWCHMEIASPCYKCGVMVKPTRILPPKKQQTRKTRNVHSCGECKPYFTMGVGAHGSQPIRVFDRRLNPSKCKCAHPPTRKALGLPRVIDESAEHDSSGSTVDTFLPQGDLMRNYVDIDDLETIPEDP